MTSSSSSPVGSVTSPPGGGSCRSRTGTDGAREVADRVGIGVSLTCAVHCIAAGALAVAPSIASTALGVSHAVLEWCEMPLLGGALLVGLWSLVPAYRFEHRRPLPLVLFLLGLTHLLASRLAEGGLEITLTVGGVGLVASAHALNLRYCGLVRGRNRQLPAACSQFRSAIREGGHGRT